MSIGFAPGPKERKKTSDKARTKRALTAKQRKYLSHRLKGKEKKLSALLAGYSKSSAENALQVIETPAFREKFAALARTVLPEEKLLLRLAEGVDAISTKFAVHEGEITDYVDVIDFEQRRKYLELAGEWTGLAPRRTAGEKVEIGVQAGISIKVIHVGSKNPATAETIIAAQVSK